MRLTHTDDSLKALEFVEKYPNQWHTFKQDKRTRQAVKRLEVLGRVSVNQFGQFRAV